MVAGVVVTKTITAGPPIEVARRAADSSVAVDQPLLGSPTTRTTEYRQPACCRYPAGISNRGALASRQSAHPWGCQVSV